MRYTLRCLSGTLEQPGIQTRSLHWRTSSSVDASRRHAAWQRPLASQAARTALLLDGRAAAVAWEEELAADARQLTARLGRPPQLAVVLVGSRDDSALYVLKKGEAATRCGMGVNVLSVPETVTQRELEALVEAVCADPGVDGVLVQLPLPRHLDEQTVMDRLAPTKDVDGFHPLNMGRTLMRGRGRKGLLPATPLGVAALLSRQGLSVAGSHAVILGDSNVVGTPLAGLLRDLGAAAVTVCHRVSYTSAWGPMPLEERAQRAAAQACLPRLPGPQAAGLQPADSALHPHQQQQRTPGDVARAVAAAAVAGPQWAAAAAAAAGAPDAAGQAERLASITRTADLLVVAVGCPELVRASWVKPGAVVVDAGINIVPTTATRHAGGGGQQAAAGVAGASSPGFRVVGDVAFDEVAAVAGAITPVPGGVGPCTIAALLANTLLAAEFGAGLREW